MGWAANPTRKVAGVFTIPIIQMGARVYLPTAGRFLQVDMVEGGTLNAYVYVGDPINGNDYSGLCAYVIQCTATVNRLQPAAPISRVQPTAPATRVQSTSIRPLQARAQTATQISSPKALIRLSIPQLKRIDMSTIPVSPAARAGDPNERVMEPKRWDWGGALNSASGYAGGGALAGGIFGCAVGAIPGAILGAAAAGVGAFPGAGVGCVGGGEVGAWVGGAVGGFIGWGLGGTSHPWANGLDGLPPTVITPW